jgi:hypothetical protein
VIIDKRLDGYVHALPLSPDKATEARRRAQQRARKKGRQASKTTLFLSGWVLIVTRLPIAVLDTAAMAALHQLRWPVVVSSEGHIL